MKLFLLLTFYMSLFANGNIIKDVNINNIPYHLVTTDIKLTDKKINSTSSLQFIDFYGSDAISKQGYKDIPVHDNDNITVYYLINKNGKYSRYPTVYNIFFNLDDIKVHISHLNKVKIERKVEHNSLIKFFNNTTVLCILFLLFLSMHRFFINISPFMDIYTTKGIILQIVIITIFFINFESMQSDETPAKYYFGVILIFIFIVDYYLQKGKIREFDSKITNNPKIYHHSYHKKEFDNILKNIPEEEFTYQSYFRDYNFFKNQQNDIIIYRIYFINFAIPLIISMGPLWIAFKEYNIINNLDNKEIFIWFVIPLLISFTLFYIAYRNTPLKREKFIFSPQNKKSK